MSASASRGAVSLDGKVLAGRPEPRALQFVREWTGLRQEEILADWERARQNEPLNDPAYFARVAVDAEAGTIAWPDGLDLAPEPLYELARTHPLVAA